MIEIWDGDKWIPAPEGGRPPVCDGWRNVDTREVFNTLAMILK